jgi:hypothetical protein
MLLRMDALRNCKASNYQRSLSHIYNELIPVRQWHICRYDDCDVPVLDNIIRYQYQAQLRQYLSDRDGNRKPYWQATSLVLAEQVKKPTGDHNGQQQDAHLACLTGLDIEATSPKFTTKYRKDKSSLPSSHIAGRRRHNNTA